MTAGGEALARARRALDGLSVGDAFGERFFGDPMSALRRIEERQVPPPPWRWTDDTAMALSIVEVLGAHSGIDRDALAAAFARRYAAEPARGYGGGAHDILSAIGSGVPWEAAAGAVFNGSGSYGNGGAMRSAPIGAYFAGDYDAVVEHAGASADPTHAHSEGRAGAIAVAVAAAAAVAGDDLFEAVLDRCPPGDTRDGVAKARAIDLGADVGAAVNALGNGSMVAAFDTAPLCIWCAARHLDSYEEAMWATVSALGDRDTTCAIVGGILANVTEIPAAWLEAREPLP